MNLTLENLPSKFYHSLLGHPLCSSKAEAEIDKLFELPVTSLKGNVFSAGKWILKLPRPVGLTTPDTHIYRVRKAEKIRKYILQHHLESQLMVPHKFLYWHKAQRTFYVVCEKVDLSEEVAKLISAEVASELKPAATLLGGQVAALAANKPQRALTIEQARALAELSTIGYTDLSYNNMYFTPDGKIAIIDTEPVKRALKKAAFHTKCISWLADRGSIATQQALSGIAKLKLFCSDEKALREVEKVEKKHVLWGIAKLAGKVALTCLAIYCIPKAIALLSIGGIAVSTLKILSITVLSIKALKLTLDITSVVFVWRLSQKFLEGGVPAIYNLEIRSYL